MVQSVQSLIEDIGELISLPEIVMQINELVNSEASSATEIARVIGQDPAISTRILQVANSSMYGGQRQIDSINRAVTILGTKQIRDLVLSTTAAKVFDGIPNDVISVEDFWHHSLYCALLARALAGISKAVNADTLFTAGLLHDIGHLVMFNRIPEQAHEAIMLTIQGEASLDLYQAEQQILGFDHAEVGAELARHWHLPEILVSCIAYHHDLHASTEHIEAVAHVHVANAIASLPYSDIPEIEDLERVSPEAWALAHIKPDSLGEAVKAAQQNIVDTQQALFGEED
ncbi:hypothetical protein MNBD_GAMMA21-2081 [hydrothermal vent metagenome]|uniref:HDOD domain-containing protein n=1 Tax=hydrothermal vent metagenome TaxID=652676 RepID=A0A3B0ZSG6_9ZZZZ